MAYINIPKVRGKMAEKGFSITSLAKSLEISRNTLSAYLEEPNKIPYITVAKMAALLCDSSDEAASIFFATNLR